MISRDDPSAPDVRALIARHLAFAHATTPPEDVHALDADRLTDQSVTFFSFRIDGEVVAIGALKRLDADHVELKSMHTAEDRRGRGIGRAMVGHLIDAARDEGFKEISLETGSNEDFAPARALYAGAGFAACEPFADYVDSPNSTFMTRSI